MKLLVCMKQVPDTNEVRIDPTTGTLIREGVPSIINHDDKNAIEEVLALKDKFPGSEVTVLTMGPPQADVALREALAMGADKAVLVSDRAFAGADTLATSRTLAASIRKLGEFDLIFCGRQAIDGDTAQVGPQLAEHLDLPQITYVRHLDIIDGKVIAERALEDGYEVIETTMPCVLTAIKELNIPRYANVRGVFDAYREVKVEVLSANDIEINKEHLGLNGSPTNVKQTFTPSPKGKGIMLDGCGKETLQTLVKKLSEKHII